MGYSSENNTDNLKMKPATGNTVAGLFCLIRGNSFGFPIKQKTLRYGCAPRGDEVYCFAIPLGRERVASDSLFCLADELEIILAEKIIFI